MNSGSENISGATIIGTPIKDNGTDINRQPIITEESTTWVYISNPNGSMKAIKKYRKEYFDSN